MIRSLVNTKDRKNVCLQCDNLIRFIEYYDVCSKHAANKFNSLVGSSITLRNGFNLYEAELYIEKSDFMKHHNCVIVQNIESKSMEFRKLLEEMSEWMDDLKSEFKKLRSILLPVKKGRYPQKKYTVNSNNKKRNNNINGNTGSGFNMEFVSHSGAKDGLSVYNMYAVSGERTVSTLSPDIKKNDNNYDTISIQSPTRKNKNNTSPYSSKYPDSPNINSQSFQKLNELKYSIVIKLCRFVKMMEKDLTFKCLLAEKSTSLLQNVATYNREQSNTLTKYLAAFSFSPILDERFTKEIREMLK